MYCQVCSTWNEEDQDYCRHCHQKLLVISGPTAVEEQETFDEHPEEQYSFDEHLLERISILEEVVKRTTGALRQALGNLYNLEQKILVNQTGLTTLRDLLESKRVFGHEEWSELWESRMDRQLLALEKRERFAAVKDRIAAHYRAERADEFRRRLDEAELAFLTFNVEGAIDVLEEAHRLDKSNHELSFFLGETFFNDGRSETATGYFNRVLAVRPDHFESLVYGGVLHHERGHGGRAEKLLRRAVALYPDEFLPSFSLGAIYAGQGKLPQATALLERAVEAEAMPQALYLLADCCYEMGRTTAAIGYLRAAVRLDPAFDEAYQLLGLACLDRRWHRKALEAFREGQRLRPARLGYRELMELLSRPQTPARIDGEALARLREGEDALARGESLQALGAYRRALTHDPESPALLLAYAMACLELGRGEEIRPVVDKLLTLDPDEALEVGAYATLIESLRLEGRFREGNRIGRKLLDENRSDLAHAVAYYELACNLADMEEDLDAALTYARRSVELLPPELERFPLAALGWVHYKRREYRESIESLSRSNDLGTSARTLTQLGMALLAAGARTEARRVLREARAASTRTGLRQSVLEVLREAPRSLDLPLGR